ncbi:four-carbon acid sugar kinase family protein [Frigidibacter sp. ROC022]|uniref:four-carbon acid sugar kinase family protein n=1 Tax=Frigidibacter sp. ROC022 TaxID=2971796 RepID=UPI00215A6769|nr:four-carbon acid sugar kinase family protein [Frigidibacter sp. ROC022]MCR8725645.1 hypothetical protein [Frigidibacter sp. ROC022]
MSRAALALVADDLTGALDAAAPFASDAARVVVATCPDALDAALETGADVIAVSTRSREIAADAAQARVAGVLARLPSGMRVVKKIDSRLKGHIGAELAAFGDRSFVVLPALPEFGRLVRNGAVEGFGLARPLPVKAVLGAAAARALVPDTLSSDDIDNALAAAPEDAVLVGARGLARALARAMGITPPVSVPALPAPVCIVVGSTDPITLAQVDALISARPETAHHRAPSGAGTVVPAGPALALVQATDGPEAPGPAVAASLARTAGPLLRAARSVVLTGGATAEALLDDLGETCLEVNGEALPGLPLCRAGGKVLVTKSGGFGGPDTLVRLLDLRGSMAAE